ncbi:MAG: hypothetical protein WAT93_07560, partial [Pontixanthobacter sp.]
MQRHFTLSIIMLTAATLTGCASSGKTYPSLEIRDAERISGAFEADSAVTAPEPLPAATLAQLPQLEAGAAAAHRAFQSAVPAASRTVQNGRGAATASDNWAASQVALGELDSLRSQAAVYLGDVDLLFVDATLA